MNLKVSDDVPIDVADMRYTSRTLVFTRTAAIATEGATRATREEVRATLSKGMWMSGLGRNSRAYMHSLMQGLGESSACCFGVRSLMHLIRRITP